jgi:hypothetical protein
LKGAIKRKESFMDKLPYAIAKVETGRLNSLVKNVMKQTGVNDPNEAIRLVNSGEWIISKAGVWREEDGIIYFSVIPNGNKGWWWNWKFLNIEESVREVIRSSEFKPTSEGKPINIAVLKGELFSDKKRTIKNIRAEAARRRFVKPNIDVSCLLSWTLTGEDIKMMGLTDIVVMHEPVGVHGIFSRFFSVHQSFGKIEKPLSLYPVETGEELSSDCGFAFAVV